MTDGTRDDAALVAAVQGGDTRALRALYDAHAPRLFGVLLRMLRVRADAEEVLQETIVEAWRRAGEWSAARGPVEAWLLAIARSRAIDRLRSRGARLRLVEESSRSVPEAEEPAPRDVHAEGRLQRALTTLPDEQRRALELAYWGGLTQREISEQLGDPLGTVKTRVRLGLQRLAELLAG